MAGPRRVFASPGTRLTDSFADLPRAEDSGVSFMVWKILRRLPKPILFILMFFLLGAVARA
jgi:hypothetical protein